MNVNISYINYYNMFANLFNQTDNKNIILEPISCIIKLVLLEYKKEGTKISISNNSIDYYEPSQFQGILRNINGDGREDLHNIYNPILKVVEWYPPRENKIFKYLYEKCIVGLNKLITCYQKESTISRTLELYCKILSDSLSEKNPEIENRLDESIKTSSPLLDQIKDFWKQEEIEMIFSLLQIIEKSNDENEKNTYIENIINTVSMKENKLSEFIKSTTTTY